MVPYLHMDNITHRVLIKLSLEHFTICDSKAYLNCTHYILLKILKGLWIGLAKIGWETIHANWCLLSLPWDTPVSAGHYGLDHRSTVNKDCLEALIWKVGVNNNKLDVKGAMSIFKQSYKPQCTTPAHQ